MANKNKRISQETFDETVKENMDDFDMSREAAIADAIEQFKMQVRAPSSLESASRWGGCMPCAAAKSGLCMNERALLRPGRQALFLSVRCVLGL